MATIDPNQEYDIIHTLTFSEASGTCRIRLYRGSTSATSGTVYYRAGTSGDWTSLSVSGTSTTFPVTSTTMQIAHNWNKSGNNYMTPSFYGATNITSITISQKSALTGTMGDYFMYYYARGCSSLTLLDVPDTSSLTSVGTYFMYNYAYGCSSLTSLAVPDTSGLTSVGDYFMVSYASGCSSLTSLAVPDTSGLTSVGTYFMYSYANGCSSLTSLAVPDTSSLTSVGSNFMYYYARNCSSLTELVLPAVGWFEDNNVSWSVPSGRLGVLKGRVLNSDDLNSWKALTAEGKTLYTNYIRDPDLVYYEPATEYCEYVADLIRTIIQTQSYNADTKRPISQSQTYQADTFRKVNRAYQYSADTLRKLKKSYEYQADILRQVRHLYIAGVDRIADLERGSLRIEQALTYQIDTCSFSIKGEQPAEGEEVIVEDDKLGRLFAGIIVKVELGRTFPDKSIKVWNVDCDDYTALLDRRLVVESYENMSASDIFLDIVAKYCPGFTTNGVRPGAPIVESTGAEFEYKRPSECFRWLCDYVGWHWQPDYYKDLHFFSAEELANPAPMVLRPGGKFRFGKHSIDTQGLRNRVYVRGGTMLSDPQVVQWKADGVARIWTLPWGPHEVSLTVGEVPMTVGVENLHDEEVFDYMMSFSEKYIRCSAQTATPVEGITMALTARQDIPVITMVEDYASQAAIAKVQGGDGVYEHIISDDSLTSIAAAEAAGLADLREHANPRVKGSFETEYYAPAVYETVQVGEEFIGWQTELEQEASDMAYYLWYDSSVAQSFIVEGSLVGAKKVRVSVLGSDREGIYPQRIDFHIYTDNNGQPGNSISTAGYYSIPGGNWPVNPEWLTGEIDLDEPLQGGQQYWLVLVGSGGSGSVRVRVAFDPLPNSTFASKPDPVSMWELRSDLDMAFKVEAPVVTPAHIWQPGQIVDIRLPDRGVEGEYLIQRVTITPTWSNPSIWTFRVEYGGRLLGIADFLKALVSAQQKKRVIEPSKSIQKYIYGEETLTVGDELITATSGLPFVCGNADAVCGLVVVSNG